MYLRRPEKVLVVWGLRALHLLLFVMDQKEKQANRV